MNGTLIDISGVTVSHVVIDGEDTTDQAHVITVKDEHGSEATITIAYGKITGSTWKR